MKKVLLTGANGFVGSVLRSQLTAAGWVVTGVSSVRSEPAMAGDIQLDIRDVQRVEQVIQDVQPDAFVHLAAVTHVPTSFREPQMTWHTNVLGTLNVLEALKKHAPQAFLLFISSSEVYGEAFKSGEKLNELSRCLPVNPYAASKLAAELACEQHFRQGFPGVIARPFNHIGPGQSPDFVTASFARQIAHIEAGLQAPVMKVGNLDASRDFLDVRDVCEAYVQLLALAGGPLTERVFNIASGRACKIRDVLDELLRQSSVSIEVQLDPERLRPSDIPFAVGDSQRMSVTTGWQARYPLSETLAELLADWRAKASLGQ
ncbi:MULTISPECIES: GDP-mannose 4,6-dehydratase [Pseudomonas]|uniref:GDP-mannose 4,6-dehydratase n=1 Tax=Pseudomonas TaxID=286 RepID=UPI000C2AB501|nr:MULTISPECIES: GDP-mannose 4,6-dehydratase [Pseudomonas]MCP3752104.1 GDP-mannose 4,6-dehydratase [Pseudomonas sp. SBB6]PJY97746.1 GDP-6-deoxy-D-lyxo-4-hexulose reductase [Pseudomonas donghuensis]WKY27013.1 GDP-mannose 4,6-dehydratase [Pseudomonas donghuensis]